VLWRRKEAFSDGVSGKEKAWYEIAKEKAVEQIGSNWEYYARRKNGSRDTIPTTQEQFFYRERFEESFSHFTSVTVPYFWMPKWCEGATDPSARTLAVYSEAGTTGGT